MGMKAKSEREKNNYMNQRADATFTDANVDRANRPHYARALKTFLVLYGTCMTRLFIRKKKPVLHMDKKKEKKDTTIAHRRALRHPYDAFIYTHRHRLSSLSSIENSIEDQEEFNNGSLTFSRPPRIFR